MMKIELSQDREYDSYLEGYVGYDLAQKYTSKTFVPACEVIEKLKVFDNELFENNMRVNMSVKQLREIIEELR